MHRLLALLLVALVAGSMAASVAKPTCGGTSTSRFTQLLTPVNPPRECVYHIKALSSTVCQLRIEFAMRLAPPVLPGPNNNLSYAECTDDYLQIGELRLCGIETKQHVYMTLNRTAGVTSVDLSIVLALRRGWVNLPSPTWDIQVRQLECPVGASVRSLGREFDGNAPSMRSSISDGFFVAPPGCLQYFPHKEGIVTSFNYNLAEGTYPGNLNYAVCFRRQEDTESLELRATVFNLGSGNLLRKDAVPVACTFSQSEDYLMVPQSSVNQTTQSFTVHPKPVPSEFTNIYCAESVDGNTIISNNPGPLLMLFNSGKNHRQATAGFYINYKVL